MKRAAIAVAIALMLALISAAYAQPQPNSTFPVVVAVDGEEYYFADHTSDPNDGNWIVLKGGAEWLLPSLEASYSGVSYASYVRDGRSITINSTFAEKAVKYPFAKHPTFKVGDTVEAAFKGSRELKGRTIEFRLIKAGPKAVRDALSAAFHGDTSKLKSLIASYVWRENATLNEEGDAELPSFKVNSSGDYLLIALNEYHEPTYRLCIYGLTLVEVLEYRCEVEAPSTVIIGSPIDVEVEMPDAPSITEGYRYGAAIIHEDAYKLSFKLTSNGYVEGTILKANGAIIVQGTADKVFKLFGVGLNKVNKDVAGDVLTEAFGARSVAVAFTDVTSDTSATLSLMTSEDMPTGTYILLVGVWSLKAGERLVAFKQLEVNVTTPPPPPPPAPPPPPTPEEVEAMPSEEAARKLEELPPEVAAELIEAISAGKAVEIVEAMKPEAAAKILEEVALEAAVRIVANVTVEKAVEIVVEVEVERAADIMEELPPARAANITEGLVKANQTLKAAQVAVAMEPTKAAMVVVKVEPHAAVPVVEAMVEVSRPRAAMVVEEAFEVDREATVEVLNEVEDEVLVDLIIAIFELPSTPQDAAAILASLAHEKALAVVRLALARDLARYVAEIFKYLPDEALVRLFRALTLEERRLVYLAAAPELKERIPAELKPLPDLAVAFKELPAEATAGEEVSIVVEASNVGEWTAPRSEASLYVNDTLLARLPVQELSPGQSVALTATWTPTKPGTYELKVEVAAIEPIEELDLANNVARATVAVKAPPPPPPPIPWPLIAGVVIAVVAAIIIAVALARMRRRAPTPTA